jgi:hypothetical protein
MSRRAWPHPSGRLGLRWLKIAGYRTFVKCFHKSPAQIAVSRDRVPRVKGKDAATTKPGRSGLKMHYAANGWAEIWAVIVG